MSEKGSKPRPYSVPRKTFDSNWYKIFSKKKKEDKSKPMKQETK